MNITRQECSCKTNIKTLRLMCKYNTWRYSSAAVNALEGREWAIYTRLTDVFDWCATIRYQPCSVDWLMMSSLQTFLHNASVWVVTDRQTDTDCAIRIWGRAVINYL